MSSNFYQSNESTNLTNLLQKANKFVRELEQSDTTRKINQQKNNFSSSRISQNKITNKNQFGLSLIESTSAYTAPNTKRDLSPIRDIVNENSKQNRYQNSVGFNTSPSATLGLKQSKSYQTSTPALTKNSATIAINNLSPSQTILTNQRSPIQIPIKFTSSQPLQNYKAQVIQNFTQQRNFYEQQKQQIYKSNIAILEPIKVRQQSRTNQLSMLAKDNPINSQNVSQIQQVKRPQFAQKYQNQRELKHVTLQTDPQIDFQNHLLCIIILAALLIGVVGLAAFLVKNNIDKKFLQVETPQINNQSRSNASKTYVPKETNIAQISSNITAKTPITIPTKIEPIISPKINQMIIPLTPQKKPTIEPIAPIVPIIPVVAPVIKPVLTSVTPVVTPVITPVTQVTAETAPVISVIKPVVTPITKAVITPVKRPVITPVVMPSQVNNTIQINATLIPTEQIIMKKNTFQIMPTLINPTQITPTQLTQSQLIPRQVFPIESITIIPAKVKQLLVTPTQDIQSQFIPIQVMPTQVIPTQITPTQVEPTMPTKTITSNTAATKNQGYFELPATLLPSNQVETPSTFVNPIQKNIQPTINSTDDSISPQVQPVVQPKVVNETFQPTIVNATIVKPDVLTPTVVQPTILKPQVVKPTAILPTQELIPINWKTTIKNQAQPVPLNWVVSQTVKHLFKLSV